MQFWVTDRRGAVEVATFSNPPHNYLDKPVIDELEQLVVQWRDPSIRAVVIQSRPEDVGFFTQYIVEELYGLTSDPTLSRYAGPLVRGYKAIFDQMTARALELAEEIASLPPMSVANAKRALYLGADTNLQAAFEIENMAWTEVMQSDDAQLALTTFLAVDADSRRDWFESENSKNYPAYAGQ